MRDFRMYYLALGSESLSRPSISKSSSLQSGLLPPALLEPSSISILSSAKPVTYSAMGALLLATQPVKLVPPIIILSRAQLSRV